MGLIDDIRKKRDSWTKRLEEHREDEEEYDGEYEKRNAEEIQSRINYNRKKVGVFTRIDNIQNLTKT